MFASSKNCSSLLTAHCSLLFIHGWATDSAVWKYQIDEFSKDYAVIAPDLPGHGEEDIWTEPTFKPAVDKVLRIAHPASSLVGIGWSMGGQTLLDAALKYPDRFKGIILVASSPCFVAREDFPFGQTKGVARRMLKDVKNDFKDAMNRFYPLNFTPDELKTDKARWFLEYYGKRSPRFHHESIAKSLEALLSFDVRKELNRIKTTVLIIHGSSDSVCPPEASIHLSKSLRNARVETMANTGHIPFLTRPDEFNKIIKGFLETL